ncbi:MAG: phosphotransferase [Hamadaea sp.]|uniref:phosphotransferase enzyme family protein n=1 Tax=Hamadaea sp. TaxID=2024425 RepID=UPI00178EDBFC|nr:phosphotransferase [Hamadaea sp.]NUT18368.1 phosphotransferase [Hamadaea sp.]
MDEPARKLLNRWGIPADATATPTDHGTNNRTFRVTSADHCWYLRISKTSSTAQVEAEHRLLARLSQSGLPFAVPKPLALPDGSTVAETPDGPASLCTRIAGVRPDLGKEAALEQFGWAAARLSDALAAVPRPDTPYDWGGGPLEDLPDLSALVRELADDEGRVLRTGAERAVAAWERMAGRLPTQVVHADLAASNVLVDPGTGAVTGVLDFELTGHWIRVIEVTVALALSGAVTGPDWPRRAAALARGGSWGGRLTPIELAALPDLLLLRAVASTLWRADRWRRGLSSRVEVTDRLRVLAEALRWRDAEGDRLSDIVAAAI